MSRNPFAAPVASQADEQKLRRERVKVTVYTVLGSMVILCLALLFQGCQNYQPASENPMSAPIPATAGSAR
jgi:hypothetical protein